MRWLVDGYNVIRRDADLRAQEEESLVRLPHGSRRATRAAAPLLSAAIGRTAGAWARS